MQISGTVNNDISIINTGMKSSGNMFAAAFQVCQESR